jgi:Protein of unknown function (DUF1566)
MRKLSKSYDCTDCRKTGYQKIISVLILTVFTVFGCFSNDGGGGNNTPAGITGNMVFYGVFEATVQIGSCDEETSTIIIGNEQDRYSEDNYVYIPEDNNNVIFTVDDEEVEILVSGYSVSTTIIGDGYSSYTQLDFSSDYNTVNISGDVTSDDPDDCTGDITGDAVRLDRFTDMEDGTVRDNRSNLLWLKDANTFFDLMDLGLAITIVNGLQSGEYGLEDGSSPGDWRLPTKSEWEELFDTNYSYPALSNTEGRGKWTQGNPFNINEYDHPYFWSQTYFDSENIYIADVNLGRMKLYPFYSYQFRAWPVREAQSGP